MKFVYITEGDTFSIKSEEGRWTLEKEPGELDDYIGSFASPYEALEFARKGLKE